MKILVVVRTFKKGGGISQWVYDYYNMLSAKKDIVIDFISEDGIENDPTFNLSSSINILSVTKIKDNPLKYYFDWKNIVNKCGSQYNFIHIHTDNVVRFFYLNLLKKKKNVIIHSHNSYNHFVEKNLLKKIMNYHGKRIVKKANFIHFACSDLAAKWLFDDQEYIQVNNGVDLKKFQFDDDARQRLLATLDLEGKTVYGHIGRFSYQKNHKKLIKIFKNILKENENSVLLLIGTGELEDQIKKQVIEDNLAENVLFLGIRNDVNELLNVMDYIIFPSHYEGLPISLVEAQANGVPVFFADTITKDVCLLPESFSFSLDESSNDIAEKIVNSHISIDRKKANQIVKDKGYDKSDVEDWLYRFYKGEVQK
ncbi:glycosyltransferase [Enterococcus asini]|uniref:glycosyltransferase n=1 Tax=Enterococcus asini TaxID=57732 RepID=UPI0032E4C3DA